MQKSETHSLFRDELHRQASNQYAILHQLKNGSVRQRFG
jgi:hypothetical protein